MIVLALIGLFLAVIPVLVGLRNIELFQHLPPATNQPEPVSILIPARNEQASIRAAVASALASEGVEFEVIVLNDHSEDDTAKIVAELAATDSRLRLAESPELPGGWCGKQHACHVLSQLARHNLLIWIDADVRISPTAMARMAAEITRSDLGLLSGFPREHTASWLESLLIPLIHFILLGYLPLWMMRESADPRFGAGCGQLFMARRKDYLEAGGHAAIRASLHDGIALPRLFRKAGKRTDLFNADDMAICRMYQSAGEVWNGLLKNAGEGMATFRAIGPWTILLIGGQVLPAVLCIGLIFARHPWALAIAGITWCMTTLLRLRMAVRFGHSIVGALLHPLGVLLLVVIQWQSIVRGFLGGSRTWKGRTY